MIPELGLFALILALSVCSLQIILPLYGVYQKNSSLMKLAIPLNITQCFFVILSFFILIYSFYTNDFSLQYVAKHSNSALPALYKLGAVWGGHEGSLLLWIFILSLWMLSISLKKYENKSSDLSFMATNLAILAIIMFSFLIILLWTSNPFARWLPYFPIEGNDLNPLLQDFGLMIHPPILYLGYVGLSIPFSFAVSLLLLGQIEPNRIKELRIYTLIAFSFLTLGIALGSWWAYYELGWGGWWFWDPVENASFMPWLLAIALIHSLIMNDKRQNFFALTLLLAILVFAFSLLGTFLVRSGLLSSVHAFASDSKRGMIILYILSALLGSALLLYLFRAKRLARSSYFALLSRESLIIILISLLLVATFSILLGSLFPIFIEFWLDKKISVGFPYYNMIFIPLMIPAMLLLPLGPFTKWGENHWSHLKKQLIKPWYLSIILAMTLPFIFAMQRTKLLFFPEANLFAAGFNFQNSLSLLKSLAGFLLFIFFLFLGIWLCLGTLQRIIFKLKANHWRSISLSALGMSFAHFGMGVMIIGMVLVSYYQIERDVKMIQNSQYDLLDYLIHFKGITQKEGSNYIGYQGQFSILRHGQWINDLTPEKRIFTVSQLVMTETAIDYNLFRDIYIALGEKLDPLKLKNAAWSVRIYYKPFIRWIWLGAILIAIGGFLAAFSKKAKKTPLPKNSSHGLTS